MANYLYQMEPAFDEDDVREVAECVRSTWVTEAKRTAAFEQAVADYVGARYAVAVPSCTVALALSLMALGVGPGDEVVVPDLTFAATANAVNLAGAIPVLADVCPDTQGLDPAALERAITPRTRAVIPVWFNGRDPGIEAIVARARANRLAVVEDAACALGSQRHGRHAGTFGDAGCFSFNTTKIITTGTGGMIVTDDPALHERVERLKNHGRLDRRDYHPAVGFNFGFTDVLAALGLAQMRKLSGRVTWKRRMFRLYREKLESMARINFPPTGDEVCLWYADIYVDDPSGLKTFLEEQGIQTRSYFPPLHTQPCYQAEGNFDNATTISARGLWLPSSNYLTEQEIDRICSEIKEFFAVRDWKMNCLQKRARELLSQQPRGVLST
jgi:perosamine synthetase